MATGTSAIIVTYNSRDDVLGCVATLLDQDDLLEVIVVDNASSDGGADAVAATYPSVRVVRLHENLGFGGGADVGARHARGDALLVLNPDVRLRPGCVRALRRHVVARGGVAGPATDVGHLGEVGWGMEFDWLGMPRPRTTPGPFFYVQGNALAITRKLFDRVGGFDERLFLFVEDTELCWRVRLAGEPVAITSQAQVHHAGGGTIGGGYVRQEGRTTSDLRFGMRERNTLAVFLACAPKRLLVVFLPLHVAKLLATTAVVFAMGRRRLALDLLRGLWWNVRHLDESLARRRTAPTTVRRSAALRGAMLRQLAAISVLRSDGLPRFVDSTPVTPADAPHGAHSAPEPASSPSER